MDNDIFHVTRKNNKLMGWNNNKIVYTREFESVESAKLMIKWVKQYFKMYGWITESKLKVNLEYILKHID